MKILDTLFTWTDKYPELGKVKEAYTMLRTQGVVHEPQKNVIKQTSKKSASSDSTLKLMESDKFKRLLQSKNQKDIEAANLMVSFLKLDVESRLAKFSRPDSEYGPRQRSSQSNAKSTIDGPAKRKREFNSA